MEAIFVGSVNAKSTSDRSLSAFSSEQRLLAIQRLTALWAFTESGLGGMLHAFQLPFTGLIIGGMAVLLITLIAFFAGEEPIRILHSMLIVLIVKAMVSPHTPVTAYVAVSFQGILGFGLYKYFRVNRFTILLLSLIAMLESAVQKLLVLTLFFGRSFWVAADDLTDYVTRQLGVAQINGSNWIIGIYLSIYLVGGLLIAWMAHKTIGELFIEKPLFNGIADKVMNTELPVKHKKNQRIWIWLILLLMISVALFLLAPDDHKGWMAVLKAFIWTSTAILLWYGLLSPIITRLIQRILKKKAGRYSEEVSNALSFLPELKQFAFIAWRESNRFSGLHRLRYFCSVLVQWSLTGLVKAPPANKST